MVLAEVPRYYLVNHVKIVTIITTNCLTGVFSKANRGEKIKQEFVNEVHHTHVGYSWEVSQQVSFKVA